MTHCCAQDTHSKNNQTHCDSQTKGKMPGMAFESDQPPFYAEMNVWINILPTALNCQIARVCSASSIAVTIRHCSQRHFNCQAILSNIVPATHTRNVSAERPRPQMFLYSTYGALGREVEHSTSNRWVPGSETDVFKHGMGNFICHLIARHPSRRP